MSKFKQVLWSNEYEYMEDFDELYRESYDLDEDEDIDYESLQNFIDDVQNDMLEIVRFNLENVSVPNKIIVIADLGLWTGRQQAYKTLGTNLADALYSECDYFTLGFDQYDLVAKATHHDGTNHYTYRYLKEGLTDRQIENFEDLLYNGLANKRHITQYTKSILPLMRGEF